MILNVQHLADWTAIKKHKQQLIHKNNQIENSLQMDPLSISSERLCYAWKPYS
jgi:hypothetical protein